MHVLDHVDVQVARRFHLVHDRFHAEVLADQRGELVLSVRSQEEERNHELNGVVLGSRRHVVLKEFCGSTLHIARVLVISSKQVSEHTMISFINS